MPAIWLQWSGATRKLPPLLRLAGLYGWLNRVTNLPPRISERPKEF